MSDASGEILPGEKYLALAKRPVFVAVIACKHRDRDSEGMRNFQRSVAYL